MKARVKFCFDSILAYIQCSLIFQSRIGSLQKCDDNAEGLKAIHVEWPYSSKVWAGKRLSSSVLVLWLKKMSWTRQETQMALWLICPDDADLKPIMPWPNHHLHVQQHQERRRPATLW